jgi:hypothetical protein
VPDLIATEGLAEAGEESERRDSLQRGSIWCNINPEVDLHRLFDEGTDEGEIVELGVVAELLDDELITLFFVHEEEHPTDEPLVHLGSGVLRT